MSERISDDELAAFDPRLGDGAGKDLRLPLPSGLSS
jgi:hypothetical protein